MKSKLMVAGLAALTSMTSMVSVGAHADDTVFVHDRERGELSPGTGAPTRERMVNAIKSASPTALYAMLEYGERVECFECIPLLADKLLSSDNAQTREISAWWLRRRSFGLGPIMVRMRKVIETDADPVMRSRAAEALGEFLDPHAVPSLEKAVMEDRAVDVRKAAVRALGRLNAVAGLPSLTAALEDEDASVRKAALEQVTRVNFFADDAALIARLADEDAAVRRAAAQLAGERRIADTVDPLMGLLMTDESPQVRQAAAISLGRIGGSDAREALRDAQKVEDHDLVRGAIDVALRMR